MVISLSAASCKCIFPGFRESDREEAFTGSGEFSGIPDSIISKTVQVPGQAIDVDISGNYAYLTGDLGILYVIDIKDKDNPEIIGKCSDLDSANIVIVEGDYAYISYTHWIYENKTAFSRCGFYIVDIGNKNKPRLIGNYNSAENNNNKIAYGLFIEDDYAYIETFIEDERSDSGYLEIVDISVKKKPVIINEYKIKGVPSNIWVKDGFAYVNTNSYDYEEDEFIEKSELIVIDLKDKYEPVIAGSCKVRSGSRGLYIAGNYAYITSWNRDEEDEKYDGSILEILNIEDSSNIETLGVYDIPGGAWEIDSAGNFIYVSSLSGGVYAVDITNRDDPVIADILNTSGTSYDVTIEGNYACIADGFGGMPIVELSSQNREAGKTYIEDYRNNENLPPVAMIEISGDRVNGDNFQIKNPVHISGKETFDPDGDELEYKWMVEGEEYSDRESFLYYFDESGEYAIELTVSDSKETSEKAETISVIETDLPVELLHIHNFKVEIEYSLKNTGDTTLKDIECFMRLPKTYYPFQTVNEYITCIQETDEVYDNYNNLFIHFKFGDGLKGDEILTASAIIDIDSCEFIYSDILKSGSDYKDYNREDEDFIKYTSDDIFIDSDNPVIIKKAESLTGNENNPVEIARILYNFVISELYYDFPRARDEKYEFFYASEIMRRGKGICVDYAILYTALLRSAGIPSRLVTGIPVYTILNEKEKEIDMGHAWVEIKLPGYEWIPIDVTLENEFMSGDYYMNIATEKGSGYLYKNKTMDWRSYYYDGFIYSWDGDAAPLTEQEFIFRVTDLDHEDIRLD